MNGTPAPASKRRADATRWIRITLRTAHLAAMGLLAGGVAAGIPVQQLPFALWATLVTGAALSALDLLHSPVFLVQVKGLAVMAKLLLFGAAIALPAWALPALIAAIVIGGVSSHMPGRYRYYSLWHRRSLDGPSG